MPKQSSKRLERHEQADVITWLADAGVIYFAVPNELGRGHRGIPGFIKGAPDLVIVTLAPSNGRPTAVEMKSLGGRLSPEQKKLHLAMKEQGWNVIVGWGASKAVTLLKDLGYEAKNEDRG